MKKIESLKGYEYKLLLQYAVANLAANKESVNDLNVFPVPDGDTGTNMVSTLNSGLSAIENVDGNLTEISAKFAVSVTNGARGNSGVITSQFFHGFADYYAHKSRSNSGEFVRALYEGVKSAYKAVAHPTEGTMLTVLRESSEKVRDLYKQKDSLRIDELIKEFTGQARITLSKTTEMLPVLKNAGVVDSGGAGIVYLFEGMCDYIDEKPMKEVSEKSEEQHVDYTKFGPDTVFEYGYCTQFLLQKTTGKKKFNEAVFRNTLEALGGSLVICDDNDKVNVHIHTFEPEKILTAAHDFGEFLSLKIENMTVQHTETVEKVRVNEQKCKGPFAVVAVATDNMTGKLFDKMGADIVIKDVAPSSSEFTDAFKKAESDVIFVFPNSTNSILSAKQAANNFGDADVFVIPTHSVAECYSALAIIDYEEADKEKIYDSLMKAIGSIYVINVSRVAKDMNRGSTSYHKGEYVATAGNDLIVRDNNALDVVKIAIFTTLENRETDVVTLFLGENADKAGAEQVLSEINDKYIFTETSVVQTQNTLYDYIISFE